MFFIPRYPSLDNVEVKFVARITNLVGYSPFLLIGLVIFIDSFGDRFSCVASDCITKYSSWLDSYIFTLSINLFNSSKIPITFGWRASSSAFRRWLITHSLYLVTMIRRVELILSVGTQIVAYFFIFLMISWMSLVFLLGLSKRRYWESSLKRVLSTAVKKYRGYWSHTWRSWGQIYVLVRCLNM